MKQTRYKLLIGFLLMAAGLGISLAQDNSTWVVPKILNTNQMEWTPVPDLEEDWLEKVLSTDPKTGAVIKIQYIPPGWVDKKGINERHFTDYREWAFTLFGSLPFCTYNDPADDTCHLGISRAGRYLDRPAYNIHGTEGPQRTAELGLPLSKTGSAFLIWREKKGKIFYVRRPTSEEFLKMDKAIFTQPKNIYTDEMDWQPHPTLKGWLVKPLTDNEVTKVSILYMPAGWIDQPNLGKPIPVKHRKYRYVLGGEMPFWYYKNSDQREPELALLQEGYFVDLPPGAVLGAGKRSASRTGCSFLQIIRYDLK
ncbi:MAG: hypothetical protein HY314_10180 [Acidobacteria bacterium]|nr:hypothetical protein [Acidobacteriota bacterium]